MLKISSVWSQPGLICSWIWRRLILVWFIWKNCINTFPPPLSTPPPLSATPTSPTTSWQWITCQGSQGYMKITRFLWSIVIFLPPKWSKLWTKWCWIWPELAFSYGCWPTTSTHSNPPPTPIPSLPNSQPHLNTHHYSSWMSRRRSRTMGTLHNQSRLRHLLPSPPSPISSIPAHSTPPPLPSKVMIKIHLGIGLEVNWAMSWGTITSRKLTILNYGPD